MPYPPIQGDSTEERMPDPEFDPIWMRMRIAELERENAELRVQVEILTRESALLQEAIGRMIGSEQAGRLVHKCKVLSRDAAIASEKENERG